MKNLPGPAEENRLAKQEASERIRDNGKSREHKEAVGRNTLQHVHLQVLVTAAELEFVPTVHPAQRTGIIKRILVGVPRPRDWISNGGVAIDLNEWGPGGGVQAWLVTKTEAVGRGLVVLSP